MRRTCRDHPKRDEWYLTSLETQSHSSRDPSFETTFGLEALTLCSQSSEPKPLRWLNEERSIVKFHFLTKNEGKSQDDEKRMGQNVIRVREHKGVCGIRFCAFLKTYYLTFAGGPGPAPLTKARGPGQGRGGGVVGSLSVNPTCHVTSPGPGPAPHAEWVFGMLDERARLDREGCPEMFPSPWLARAGTSAEQAGNRGKRDVLAFFGQGGPATKISAQTPTVPGFEREREPQVRGRGPSRRATLGTRSWDPLGDKG